MAWADRPCDERFIIDYCAPRGIPLEVFRGRVVYPGDPQWLDGDREAVYDWLVKEASRCRRCGTDTGESLKIDNSFAFKAEALACHACKAIHREVVRLAGNGAKEDPTAGISYRVSRRDGDG